MSPMVRVLIVMNSVIFFLQLVFERWMGVDPSFIFGLVPALITQKLFLWQFLTYQFLHGHLMHLLFNMFVLWMLGGEIEEKVFWAKGFLKYYLICGVGAGVFNVLFSFNSPIPIIGSSGAMYGVLVAYALFFGNRQLILFPFPVMVRAKYLVLIIGGVELISSIFYTTDGIAHIAHLGGMIVGYIYIHFKIKRPPHLWRFWKNRGFSRNNRRFTVIDGGDH